MRRRTKALCCLLVAVFLGLLFGCNGASEMTKEERLTFIQKGVVNAYPTVQIGEAFDRFFKDCVWTAGEKNTVTMEGKAFYDGELADYAIVFRIDDDQSFTLVSASVTPQGKGKTIRLNKKDRNELIKVIFDTYSEQNGTTQPDSEDPVPSQKPETNEKNPEPTPASSVPADSPQCSHCHGSGHCQECGYGECSACFGERAVSCEACFGSGDCSRCDGQGGEYVYTFGDIKWKKCVRCGESGECTSCKGNGERKCSVCNGSGECQACAGTAECRYCGGTRG